MVVIKNDVVIVVMRNYRRTPRTFCTFSRTLTFNNLKTPLDDNEKSVYCRICTQCREPTPSRRDAEHTPHGLPVAGECADEGVVTRLRWCLKMEDVLSLWL